MKRNFVLDNAGVHIGCKFTFDSGSEYTVLLSELAPNVLAHAAANGLGEAFRDTGAGKTDAESEAAFLKRREVILGGEYSARGGSRLDWVGDILEAIERIMAKAGKFLSSADKDRLTAELQAVNAKGTDAVKDWLKANATRKAIAKVVDSIRKERAADAAKARTADIDIKDII